MAGFGHMWFWTNQIPGFFDHQYLWKKSIDTLMPDHYQSFLLIYFLVSNIVGVHLVMTFSQSEIIFSKLTTETLEQGEKYVQS